MKTAALALLLFLAAAGAAWLLRSRPPEQPAARVAAPVPRPPAADVQPPAPAPPPPRTAQENLPLPSSHPLMEKARAVDDAMFKQWLSTTPEMKARLWESKVRSLNRRYGEAFQSLNVDEATAAAALEIIVQKEKNLEVHREQLNVAGFTQGGREFAAAHRQENATAATLLRGLLGDATYEKLAFAEQKMAEEAQARAAEAMARFKNGQN